jgi:RND superfamily putative drug exporter
VTDPAFRSLVTGLQADLQKLAPAVIQRTLSFYQTKDPALVSRDGHATLVPVVMTGTLDDAKDNVPQVQAIVQDHETGGFELLTAGQGTLSQDFDVVASEDLKKGESFGIVVALAVLLVVFGAVVAALLPIGIALMSIAVAVGVVALLGQVFHFSFFVTNMITMMGLAVAIDYSLFVVSRYREERELGREKMDAIGVAGSTASRAVLFSGMTVVLALLGMLIIPTTIFRSLAAGAILVVLAAVAASLTLLPAVLGLLGDRVNALRVRRRRPRTAEDRERHGFWAGVARVVMRRPVISLVAAASFLILLAVPLFRLQTGTSGVSTLPDSIQSKRAFTVLATEFSGGLTSPVKIAVEGDVNSSKLQTAIGELQGFLKQDGGFGPSTVQVDRSGDLAVIEAPVVGDPSGKDAVAAVGRVRADYVPKAFPPGTATQVLVGGQTALNKDFFDLTSTYQPIVFVFVLGLSFLLLMMVFRSVVVPAKAIVLNLLSVGAAYGLLSLVFEKGGLAIGRSIANLFGFQQVDAVEAWLPLFLFSVLFGLSMDYHVFLLSRIRERFLQTGDNAGSVAYGVRTTAGIITGAALIMVAVFGGFAAGQLVMFQQMGFGLAVAVLIDATIVRSVLVPASMKLLGNWNWYMPRWLHWLPDLSPEPPQPVVIPDAERIPAKV